MATHPLSARELATMSARATALVDAAARVLLARERREILAALARARTVAEMDVILDDVLRRYRSRQGIFYRRWVARLLALDTRLYRQAAKAVAPDIRLVTGPNDPPSRHARTAAREIADTAADRLARLRARWKLANGTVEALQAQAKADHLNRRRIVKRAQVIARTEAHIMLAGGQHVGATQGGLTRKRWKHDNRRLVPPARENHIRYDGMVLPIEVPFPNGMQHPHELDAPAAEVVNCACVAVYLP